MKELIAEGRPPVPHSRPRLFMIGVRGDVEIPAELTRRGL
jgi:hypothetical protein